MSLSPINAAQLLNSLPQVGGVPTSLPGAGSAVPGAAPGVAGDKASFSNLVNDMLQQANQQQLQADANVGDLVTGKTDNVDDVVLSVVKADLAFRMILEIRNRLTQSYQEVMRMQV